MKHAPIPSSRRLVPYVLAAAGFLLGFPVAWAAPPSFAQRHSDLIPPVQGRMSELEKKETSDRAREQFAQGVAAYEAGDFKGCEDHFARVWVLQGSMRSLLNLGICEIGAGYDVDATEHLTVALIHLAEEAERADPDPRDVEDRTRAADALIVAKQRLAALDVQSVPAGGTIVLTPKVVAPPPGAAPVPAGAPRTFTAPMRDVIYLYPGDYKLQVLTQAGEIYAADLHLLAGQHVVHAFHVEDPPPPPPSLPILLAGFGASAVFLGTGLGFMAASQSRLSEADRLRPEIGALFGSQTGACYAPTGPRISLCQRLDAATDDGALFEDLGIAAFLASGVLAAGTTAYALWPRERAPVAPAPQSARLRLVPVLGPTGGGLFFRGEW